jgi:hypothetical protein
MSKERKRSSSNLRTQRTSKQKKPKKLKARKERDWEKFVAFNIKR